MKPDNIILAVIVGGVGLVVSAQKPKVLAPYVPVPPKLQKRQWDEPVTRQSAIGGLWMTNPNMNASIFEEWFEDGFGGGHAYSVSQQWNTTARREAALGSIGFLVMSYLLTSMARRF